MFFATLRLLLVVLLSLPFSAFAVYNISQTGQQESYGNNDDGKLQLGTSIPTQRLVDNLDGTVTDKLTNLIWLKDSYCANHHISGASSNSWQTAFDFVNALNNKTLISSCKDYEWTYNDWRVANINELQSLIPKGLTDTSSLLSWFILPGDNSNGFVDTPLAVNPVWSSTTDSNDINKAWTINLDTGETQLLDKISLTSMGYIFSAVRGNSDSTILATQQTLSYYDNDDGEIQNGYKTPIPRFVNLSDGTIVDKATGLNWLQDANCAQLSGSNWQTSISSTYSLLLDPPFFSNCTNYIKAEKDTDWRIPNFNELQSLVDYSQSNPALAVDHPFQILLDKPFWTSTSSNGSSDTAAWSISFEHGQTNPLQQKSESAYAWPVRGPIDFADIETNIDDIQFDSQYTNATPSEKSLEITNSGNSILIIDNVFIGDNQTSTSSRNFRIGRDGCSNRSVDPKTSCSTVIEFTPSSNGPVNAFIKIESNALGIEEKTLTISGKGIGVNLNKKSSTKCFIATAAYGSFLEPEVITLRNFRDQYLLTTTLGTQLVNAYYYYSPPIADKIKNNELLRTLTRIALSPIVYSIKYPVVLLALLLLAGIIILKRYTHNA